MATPARSDVLAQLRALQAGIKKNLASSSLIIAGKALTGPQAAAFVQTCIDSVAAVQTAQGTLHQAVAADKAFQAKNRGQLNALRNILALMYTDDIATLEDFGLSQPKKRTPLSNDALLLRAAKARATRTKRRTMGKRQKAAIKGEVTGVVITPVTSTGSSGGSSSSGTSDGDG